MSGIFLGVGCARKPPLESGVTAPLPAPPKHQLPTVTRWLQWSHEAPLARIDYPADWEVQEDTPPPPSSQEGDKDTVFQVRFAGPDGTQFVFAARTAPAADEAGASEARRQAAHKKGRLTLTGQEEDYTEEKPQTLYASGNPGLQSTLQFRRKDADWKGLRVTVPLQRHYFLCEALTPAAQAKETRPIFDEMVKSLLLGD